MTLGSLGVDRPLYEIKAELFKALGHPARIRILELLADDEVPVSSLLTDTGMEPSHLSQHLAVLRRAQHVDKLIHWLSPPPPAAQDRQAVCAWRVVFYCQLMGPELHGPPRSGGRIHSASPHAGFTL